jgi:SUMO ligase MMS21 Smc5/6 complex component
MTWNMARKLKIIESEKHPLDDLKNDDIIEKREKMRYAHRWTLNMARKLKITENDKYLL